MKNTIIKTTVPDDSKEEKTPKKKNFRFLKFRRARPEKKTKTIIREKEILPEKMVRDRHGIPDSEDMCFEEWMSLAIQYAKQYHKITFQSDHGFWNTVASHWHLKSSPSIGVKDAIIIWDLKVPGNLRLPKNV